MTFRQVVVETIPQRPLTWHAPEQRSLAKYGLDVAFHTQIVGIFDLAKVGKAL